MGFNYESVASQINTRREDLGYSYQTLAEMVGMNKSTLQRYTTGEIKNIGLGRLRMLCDALELDVVELLGIPAPKLIHDMSGSELEHMAKYRGCDQRGKNMVDTVLDYEYNRTLEMKGIIVKTAIKVYDRPAAAGFGEYLSDSSFEIIDFAQNAVPKGADFGVRISGNSMEPEIPDGCIVFVKACPAIESGQIGIFSLDNDSLCKRLEVNHDHRRIRLLSTNPDYEPILVTSNQYLYTFGQVLSHT